MRLSERELLLYEVGNSFNLFVQKLPFKNLPAVFEFRWNSNNLNVLISSGWINNYNITVRMMYQVYLICKFVSQVMGK